jgi:hypothetical protein
VRKTVLSTHGMTPAGSPCEKQPFPRTGQFRQSRRASNSPFCARGGLRQGRRAQNRPFHARDDSGRVAVRKTALSTHGMAQAGPPCAKQPFLRTGRTPAGMPCVKQPFPRTGRLRQGRRAQNRPFHARDGSGGDAVRQTALPTHGYVSTGPPCAKQPFPRTGRLN